MHQAKKAPHALERAMADGTRTSERRSPRRDVRESASVAPDALSRHGTSTAAATLTLDASSPLVRGRQDESKTSARSICAAEGFSTVQRPEPRPETRESREGALNREAEGCTGGPTINTSFAVVLHACNRVCIV